MMTWPERQGEDTVQIRHSYDDRTSRMTHPKSQETLTALSPDGARKVAEVAATLGAVAVH
jgi:hypothetical protein